MKYANNFALANSLIEASEGLVSVDDTSILKQLVNDGCEPDLAIEQALTWVVDGLWSLPRRLRQPVRDWIDSKDPDNEYSQDLRSVGAKALLTLTEGRDDDNDAEG